MAIRNYRYSTWDGRQDVPDFTADDLLEKMADDLLRGGDPQRAMRNLLRRGFQLPDGRRFEGMKRLFQEMREYRKDVFSRYDPNGLIDAAREQLDEILRLEQMEIGQRRQGVDGPPEDSSPPEVRSPSSPGQSSVPRGSPRAESPGENRSKREGGLEPHQGSSVEDAPSQGEGAGDDDAHGEAVHGDAAATPDDDAAFEQMLERLLRRKEEYLSRLPSDNAGKIRGLREYDFLSPAAREAFDRLVGGMQRELMDQFFQGLKEGIGQVGPDQMSAIRQMVQDLNEMLEASQMGDRQAFDRFMKQHSHHFPAGTNSLDDLLEHLQRQSAAMKSLLDSMDAEQRAELESMMDELLRDDRLRLDLARLGANLSAMGFRPEGGGFPFRGQEAPGFGQSLDMMRRLQAMQNLENAMGRGDPLNAMTQAGNHDPRELFGDRLGGQIEAVKDMAESLLEAGYLQQTGERLSLTARAIRRLGDASLREIFQKLKDDRGGGHSTRRKGSGGDITEDSRPYQFGDPFHVDIKGTVMNGVSRAGSGTPVQIAADDFAIFESERSVQHATVLALDMSHSMYLSGLFLEAKKTALALDSLIRGQFPRDALYLIGFANVAFELSQEQLPGLVENDYVMGTNYEMALSLARKLLSRHRGGNRQILFVTDGEPTACTLPNGNIFFDWPPHPYVLDSALLEADRCARDGIVINSFLLESDPRLVAFVEEMTAVNKGRMFLSGSQHLSEQVVLDYMQGRKVRHLH